MKTAQEQWNELGRLLEECSPELFRVLLQLVVTLATTGVDVLIVGNDAPDLAPAEGS